MIQANVEANNWKLFKENWFIKVYTIKRSASFYIMLVSVYMRESM